jgi:RNA polymerase sigma-70 factor (family 1)
LKDYATYSDEQLVNLLKEGDESAFKEVYDRYWDKLLYKAAQITTGNISLAEEAVQDVFISIWKQGKSFQVNNELRSYLFAAMTFNAIRIKRRQIREANIQKESVKLYSESEYTTDNTIALHSLQQAISKLLNHLPDQTHLIYTMHKEEGRSYNDIASELNISPKTVDYHLSKAVKHLRTALSGLFTSFLLFF